MPSEIYLVKVGMTMTEGTVEEWYVKDGGKVASGELLYRLETEKVNLDVDAETEGTVKHLAAAGDTLAPGAVIGFIFAPGEKIPAKLPKAKPQPEAANDAAGDAAATPAGAPPAAPAAKADGGRHPASPAARKLAQELGVALEGVTGTGPRGRITRQDVEAAAAAPPVAAPEPTAPESVKAIQGEPLKGLRKTIAQRMHASLAATAQLTIDMEAGMDEAVKLRTALAAAWQSEGVRPGYTDLVMLAAAKALTQHPRMNAALIGDAIMPAEAVHMGMAVALEDGLVVPVIHNAAQQTLKALAKASAELAEKARAGTLTLTDVQGGTFTVTSLGMYGVDGFTPILNAPQTGILGIGRIYEGIGWNDNLPVKHQCLRLSLTWDHRVLDGAPAAKFLACVRDYLETPHRLLA